MATLQPVSLRLVDPAWVDETPAPAYDALTPEDRQRYLAAHPLSYLAVTRGPTDAPAGEVWDANEAQRQSRNALNRIVDAGAFGPVREPSLYLYRLTQNGQSQLALVGGVATDDYNTGTVRLHENLMAERAKVLLDQMVSLQVQSSPIALTYEPIPEVAVLLTNAMSAALPALDFTSSDGLRQQVWPITDHTTIAALQQHFDGQLLHLVDGHHRAAAAAGAAESVDGASLMLSALIVTTELQNHAFHRFLHGVDADDLLTRIGDAFGVWPNVSLDDVHQRHPSQLAARTRDAWHLLDVPNIPVTTDLGGLDAKATACLSRLESTRLQHFILGPLLRLEEDNPGRTLAFRDGRADRDDLIALEHVAAAADGPDMIWVTRPVSIETFIAVSASNLKMPPKSTYFVPKVRSGVFVRHL